MSLHQHGVMCCLRVGTVVKSMHTCPVLLCRCTIKPDFALLNYIYTFIWTLYGVISFPRGQIACCAHPRTLLLPPMHQTQAQRQRQRQCYCPHNLQLLR
jgi:hypothetical protein